MYQLIISLHALPLIPEAYIDSVKGHVFDAVECFFEIKKKIDKENHGLLEVARALHW